MIVNGKEVALEIQERLRGTMGGKSACFVLFGDNAASKKFIERKMLFAKEIGVKSEVKEYPELSQDSILEIVTQLAKEDYSGIVIQLPLPSGIDADKVLDLLPISMDVDVLGRDAKDQYRAGASSKIPPVARAIKEILNHYGVTLDHKKVLVVGRGKLVGEPVAMMLEREGYSFQIIDKDTPTETTALMMSNADIIISGAGSPHFIRPEMIKEGVVLIDAGTSEQNGRLVGDVDPRCESKAELFTPVPGGVGPVTVASLFLNL